MRWSSLSSSLIVVFGVAFDTGCASQSSQQAERNPRSGGAQETLNQTNEGLDCMDEPAGRGLALYQAGRGSINGHDLVVYTGRSRQTTTFCEIIKRSNKPVAIFQFAGFDCISCQDEAAELKRRIMAYPQGAKIAQVTVLTDRFEDVRDDQFQKFIDDYASGTIVVYDEAKLWKKFSADPTLPNRATIMTMNAKMEAVVINSEKDDPNPNAAKTSQEIIDAAVSLLP